MTERTARPPALSLGVLSLELPAGERWWGGAVPDGGVMPFGDRPHHRDLAVNAGLLDDPTGGANQSAPCCCPTAVVTSGPTGRSPSP